MTEEVFLKSQEDELERRRAEILDNLLIDEDKILDSAQLQQVKDLMHKHKDIFSTSDTDIGLCTSVKHRIDLLDDTPFKQRHTRIPPSIIEEIRQHLEQLLACDIIRSSKSPFASNVVLLRKKNGSLSLCIDYRQLNDGTVKDSYALPRIEEILDCYMGLKFSAQLIKNQAIIRWK